MSLTFSPNPYNRAPVSITFFSNTITIVGCNTITLPYQASADSSISIQQGTSTNKCCPNDYDQEIVNMLLNSKIHGLYGYDVYALSSTANNAPTLYAYNPANGDPFFSYSILFPGQYTIQAGGASFSASFPGSSMIVQGCNRYSIPYRADSNGKLTFNQPTATFGICPSDAALFNDLGSTTGYINTSSGFNLVSSSTYQIVGAFVKTN